MKIAVIGRTAGLLSSDRAMVEAGHRIGLVITAEEAPEYSVTAQDFAAFAQEVGAPFVRTARIGTALSEIRAAACDVAISINYVGVIPQVVIDCFRLGILNAHGGDLPRYRGNACQAWAILNQEPVIGLCIHRMIGGELDSGDIIAEDKIEVGPSTMIKEVLDWMERRTPELMAAAVDSLATDPGFILRSQSLDPRDALRCYPRLPEDGRIDWHRSAEEIVRLVNASGRPFGGAFSFLDEQRVSIWEARLVEDDEIYLAVPGQVTRIADRSIEVATGGGKIAITDHEGADFRSIRQRLR